MESSLYIVWNDKNNLGIAIIDEQHRGIISTINSLYYFIQTGHEKEILKPTLIMLEQYTKIHFATEEALMTAAGYPELNEHLQLHKKLAEETQKLSRRAVNDEDPGVILKFLKDWWLSHINKEDRKYLSYLKKE